MQFEYEMSDQPSPMARQAPPPAQLSDLADTLQTKRALKIRTTGLDDVEIMRIQAWINGLPKRYKAPFSVATSRQREGDQRYLYAWAIPPRVRRAKRESRV